MSAKTGCFALLVSLFSLPLFAETGCILEGKISLDKDVVITCKQGENLILDKSLHIITNGHRVEFRAQQKIIGEGFAIDVVEGERADLENGLDARPIVFNAETVTGNCKHIHNDGYKNGSAATVKFQVISYTSTEYGQFKCQDITTKGAGQGLDSRIVALGQFGEIPFTEFAFHVMN